MNLTTRLFRRILGMKPEPRPLSESDLRLIDMGYGLIVGLAAMGAVTVVLLTFSWRPVC